MVPVQYRDLDQRSCFFFSFRNYSSTLFLTVECCMVQRALAHSCFHCLSSETLNQKLECCFLTPWWEMEGKRNRGSRAREMAALLAMAWSCLAKVLETATARMMYLWGIWHWNPGHCWQA